jgi:hypothetical protein
MPAVRGDGMRGLAVFISDIRNCEYLKHSRLIIMLLFFLHYTGKSIVMKFYLFQDCSGLCETSVLLYVCNTCCHSVFVVSQLVFVLLPVQILIRRLDVVIEDFIFVSKTVPG